MVRLGVGDGGDMRICAGVCLYISLEVVCDFWWRDESFGGLGSNTQQCVVVTETETPTWGGSSYYWLDCFWWLATKSNVRLEGRGRPSKR